MKLAALVCMLLLVLAGTAPAAVVGVLGLGSDGGVIATLTTLFFQPDPIVFVPPCPTCAAAVNNTTTLTFTGGPLGVGEGVHINHDLTFSGTTPTDFFFQFAAHPLLDFELTAVVASGAQPNCSLAVSNGQTCSIMIGASKSPVVLQANGTGGTIASITLAGLASDTGVIGPGASNWVGSFSPTIPNMTPEQIAEALCPAYVAQGHACTLADVGLGLSIRVPSNSGSFTASNVPEPGTLSFLMLGSGLILCGTVVRRLSQRP